MLVWIAEDELARLQRRARPRRRLFAGALYHRLRQSVAEPEVVMGVVERRRGVKSSTDRLRTPSAPGHKLVVFSRGARACSASLRANRIAMACKSSPASPPTQLSGALAPVSPRMSARAAMPCAKRLRESCQRFLGHPECA